MDTSWTSSAERDERSQTGIVVHYHDAVIYSNRYTAKFVTLITTETDFVALPRPCRLVYWLR